MKKLLLFIALLGAIVFGCSKNDSTPIPIEINIVQNGGDAGATFVGTGGNGSKTVIWSNSLRNTNWDMDITNATRGTFRLQVKDSMGVLVLDKTLTAGSGVNSLTGTSTTGTASGSWTITVIVTNFNGTGSFTLTPA